MRLAAQKRLAAQLSKCSKKRIWLDPNRLDEIKEAITKADIKSLIKDGAIVAKPIKGISRSRARKILLQKRKGRRKGTGSRKGKRTARLPRKKAWILKIRAQRKFLKLLRAKGLIGTADFRKLYLRAKGGFFRGIRHIKLYLEEQGIAKK